MAHQGAPSYGAGSPHREPPSQEVAGRILPFLLLVGIAAAPLTGQVTFQRTYGGAADDECYCGQQTADGGYVACGRTFSYGLGYGDVWLVRVDTCGDTLWTRTYGGTSWEHARSVQQTHDGGFIIAGYTLSFSVGGYDFWLIRTDAGGDTVWTRTFGGPYEDFGYSVQQTADGGHVMVGSTYSFGAGQSDVLLIRVDADGNTLWSRTYGGGLSDKGHCVQQTADGGYIIAGTTSSFGAGFNDAWLVKTDADGDTMWTRTCGGSYFEEGEFVRQTHDGGYVLAGHIVPASGASRDLWLVKTDGSGDTVWTRTHGGAEIDMGLSVQQTADSGYIVAGYTASFGAGDNDFWLIRTGANGDTIWAQTYGGTWSDWCTSVGLTADGGYVVAGNTDSQGAGGTDFWLIKTDARGQVAVAEPASPMTDGHLAPTFARGVLFLEGGRMKDEGEAGLLDISGRKVMELRPGDNDVRHLSPGIYFVRLRGERDNGSGGSGAKVVVTE